MIINLMQFMIYSFIHILGAQIKRILALSLNWKVNFKLFSPEMGHSGSMCLQ